MRFGLCRFDRRAILCCYRDWSVYGSCAVRYHVKAWGHPTAPDLDYETDADDRKWLMQNYPCTFIALQIAVPYNAVIRLLDAGAAR